MASETVTLHCSHPNGVLLRLFEMRDDGLGFPYAHLVESLTVQNGVTHGVDADFFNKWIAQNADNSLVTSGAIHAAEE